MCILLDNFSQMKVDILGASRQLFIIQVLVKSCSHEMLLYWFWNGLHMICLEIKKISLYKLSKILLQFAPVNYYDGFLCNFTWYYVKYNTVPG